MHILYVNFNVVLLLFSKPLGTVLVWIRICLDPGGSGSGRPFLMRIRIRNTVHKTDHRGAGTALPLQKMTIARAGCDMRSANTCNFILLQCTPNF